MLGKLDLAEFFTSTNWRPDSVVRPQFGILALLVGSASVTALAMLIAVPLGLGAAVYVSEFAGRRTKETLEGRHRAAGRHPVRGLGLHRHHGAWPDSSSG